MNWRILAALVSLVVSLPWPAAAVTVERVISPGGIEAWLVEDHTNPIIAVEIAFKGGAALDPAGKSGLAEMVAGLLDEGAGPYDSLTFQQTLEDLAVTLHFDAGLDNLRGHLKTLTENRDKAFELLRLALTLPRFDKEPTERIRSQMISGLVRESQNPNAVAQRHWFKAAFGGHPYGGSPHGSIETVKVLQKGDLRAFARDHLARDRLVVAVVGDIAAPELGRLLDATFGPLPAAGGTAKVAEAKTSMAGGVTLIDKDNPQTVAMFGLPGLLRDDPMWYAAYVVNYILGGGGFSSRLTEEVREKRGLAYSVYSYLMPLRHGGVLVGGVATENGRFGESLALIRDEIRKMRDDGPTAEELASAKTYLNGSFPLQLESTSSIAGLLLQMQLDRLGPDFLDRRRTLIDAVSMDDVKRAAARLLSPEGLFVVAVGRPAGL